MSKVKKKQLGQGLKALLSNIDKKIEEKSGKEEIVKELASSIAEIPTSAIEVNPFQPRTEFDQEELLNLVQSIKNHGLIQPITVRKLDAETFQLISGERRWRASKLAGLKSVPAYIRLADDQGMLEMALVENIQRSQLNAIEVSLSLQRLMDECQLSHEVLATRVGKKRSTVSNYLRLLKLPPKIQNAIKYKEISMGHARALIGLEDDPTLLLAAFRKVVNQTLSVRATEELVKKLKNTEKEIPQAIQQAPNPELKRIKSNLEGHFGAKVDINRNDVGKGKIQIFFNSDDDLNNILETLELI